MNMNAQRYCCLRYVTAPSSNANAMTAALAHPLLHTIFSISPASLLENHTFSDRTIRMDTDTSDERISVAPKTRLNAETPLLRLPGGMC
jgi:hypothetical protein